GGAWPAHLGHERVRSRGGCFLPVPAALTASAPPCLPWSILVGQPDGDDQLSILARTTDGLELDPGRGALAVVLADMDREALLLALAAAGSHGQQEQDIPEPARFGLVVHTFGHAHTAVPGCPGQRHRVADANLAGGF